MNEFKNLNQTEMQEIRPNIFVMVSYWISQHLILVGIIIAVLLSLCSCQKAAAAEPYDGVSTDPYNINSLEDALDYMNITSAQKQTILDAFEQYAPYYQIYFDNDYHSMAVNGTDVAGQYITCPFVDSSTWRCSGMYYLAKADITPTYVLVLRIYGSSVSMYFKTPGSEGNYMTVMNSHFQDVYGSDQTFRQYYDNTGEVLISGDVSPECAKQSLYCYSIEGQHVLMQDNRAYVRPLGEDPVYGFPESHKFFIREQPTYVSDDRLKFSTSLRGDGEKLLNTDLSGFVHWGPADNQDISDLVLTLDCDGTEVIVELDDTNSEIVNTKNPNYSKTLVYITPYSEFGLDEYEDVTIVKCDFTHIDYALIGTVETDYNISCNYILKNETAPIESEEIERDDNVEGDKLTQQDMDDVYYNIHFNDDADLDFDEFFDVEFPDGFSFYYVCLKNVASSWSDMIEDGFILPSDIYYLVTQTMPNKAALEEYIASWIKDNQAALFYDVVVFDYVQETNTTLTHTYYYYTTESGRIRAISNLLADIYQESNQTAVNTAAIYDYMYTRLDDFEDKSLEAFNDMIALDRQRNTWLSTISSGVNTLNQTSLNGFADVVEAINGIDIPVPEPFDDSDILGGITDILDKLDDLIDAVEGHSDNEDDTVSEAIAYYQAHNSNGMPTSQVFLDNKMSIWMAGKVHLWLQGSNASDTKTSLLSDAFDTLTSMYQAMSSEQYFFSGISGYLDDLTNSDYSSDGETDPDKYYINFFFKPGYDPDRYDGGGIIISE